MGGRDRGPGRLSNGGAIGSLITGRSNLLHRANPARKPSPRSVQLGARMRFNALNDSAGFGGLSSGFSAGGGTNDARGFEAEGVEVASNADGAFAGIMLDLRKRSRPSRTRTGNGNGNGNGNQIGEGGLGATSPPTSGGSNSTSPHGGPRPPGVFVVQPTVVLLCVCACVRVCVCACVRVCVCACVCVVPAFQ